MTSFQPQPDDEPERETPFFKALQWRVHCPDEADHIAATHSHKAAEARCGIPAMAATYQDQCRAALLESRARNHDAIVAVCMRHAARLRSRSKPIKQ